MTKKQKNVRISSATESKLKVLASDGFYGTDVEAISIAIDRLYHDVQPSDEARLKAGAPAPCAECGRPVQPGSNWQAGSFGEVYHSDCMEEKMEKQIEQMANEIYTEIFGIDNRRFENSKRGQIEDWLRDGDLEDEPTIHQLVEEWIEFDNIGVFSESDSPNGLADVWNDLTNYQPVEKFFRDDEVENVATARRILTEYVQSYDLEMPRWIILHGTACRTVDVLTEYVVDMLDLE